MQKHRGRVLFSACDVVDHLECAAARAEDDDTLALVLNKRFVRGEQFLEKIKKPVLRILEMPSDGPPAEFRERTVGGGDQVNAD